MSDEAPANVPPPPRPAQPLPSTPPGPKSSKGGSSLKALVPIVILVVVVFGVTLVSQYTPKQSDDPANGSSKDPAAKGEQLLKFGSSLRTWMPRGKDDAVLTQSHMFPGCYEPTNAFQSAFFWFENPRPTAVTLKVQSSWSPGSRLALIPPEVTDQLVLTSILSGFPQGSVSGLPLAFTAATAQLDAQRLSWQGSKWSEVHEPEYHVPAAPGGGHLVGSQWGIFDLQFTVPGVGSPPPPGLVAVLTEKDDATGTTSANPHRLAIGFEGMDAFEPYPKSLDVGEWTEDSEPRTFNFVVYSSTRGPERTEPGNHGDLAPPTIQGDLGPFVVVGAPVRIPAAQLPLLAEQITQALAPQKKQNPQSQEPPPPPKPVRVESAYRYTVTVKAKEGDRLADIGALEREITLALPDAQRKTVYLRGYVRGPVSLDNRRKDIDVPVYQASSGMVQTVRLTAEQRDMDVALIPGECTPKFAKYEMRKMPQSSDLTYYELKITVPKDSVSGPWSGVIVLEIKGPKPQRIRIPIRGAAKY